MRNHTIACEPGEVCYCEESTRPIPVSDVLTNEVRAVSGQGIVSVGGADTEEQASLAMAELIAFLTGETVPLHFAESSVRDLLAQHMHVWPWKERLWPPSVDGKVSAGVERAFALTFREAA